MTFAVDFKYTHFSTSMLNKVPTVAAYASDTLLVNYFNGQNLE